MEVAVVSHERIGKKMAGPAIRSFEFARTLSEHFSVTLAAPDLSIAPVPNVELFPFAFGDSSSLGRLEGYLRQQADIVISSGHLAVGLPFVRDLPIPWVADLYIPTPVESLAYHTVSDPPLRAKAHAAALDSMRKVITHADFFICASERQRDYWLGVLTAHGRLTPSIYAADPEARNLIDVVPFGCSTSPPQAGPILRETWPGIRPDDRIIIWGGGIWNWLDPITLIQAMPQVLKRHPEAKLLFLGADHPDRARVPQMARAREACSLSQDLGLEDKSILWGDWVPYGERGAYLVEADLGVCLHHRGLEARFAFRTRLLDAIWTGLPMVLSPGDVLAEEFERAGLGYVVEYGAVDEVADAIGWLLDEDDSRATRREGFQELREAFGWQRVIEPLIRFCQAPRMWSEVRERTYRGKRWARESDDEKLALRSEIARLQGIVDGYRSGRLMRFLAFLHRVRRRIGLG